MKMLRTKFTFGIFIFLLSACSIPSTYVKGDSSELNRYELFSLKGDAFLSRTVELCHNFMGLPLGKPKVSEWYLNVPDEIPPYIKNSIEAQKDVDFTHQKYIRECTNIHSNRFEEYILIPKSKVLHIQSVFTYWSFETGRQIHISGYLFSNKSSDKIAFSYSAYGTGSDIWKYLETKFDVIKPIASL